MVVVYFIIFVCFFNFINCGMGCSVQIGEGSSAVSGYHWFCTEYIIIYTLNEYKDDVWEESSSK